MKSGFKKRSDLNSDIFSKIPVDFYQKLHIFFYVVHISSHQKVRNGELTLHGENRALNGDNIVAFQNIYVLLINTYIGVMHMCVGCMYLCIARNQYVFLFGATLKAC
jgi:hypothetical protein